MDELERTALETELTRLPAAEPAPALRGRVLATVRRELERGRVESWTWYVASMAAALVLWANLSWSVSRETTYDWRSRGETAISTEQITRLVPEISRYEAQRQAVLLSAGRFASPDPSGSAPPPSRSQPQQSRAS